MEKVARQTAGSTGSKEDVGTIEPSTFDQQQHEADPHSNRHQSRKDSTFRAADVAGAQCSSPPNLVKPAVVLRPFNRQQ